MRPRLALVPGEPAGVGPELCVRLVQQPRTDCDLIAFADPDTLQAAARLLRDAGAGPIEAWVTHCLATAGDLERIEGAGISSLRATDTVPGPAASIHVAALLAGEIARRGWLTGKGTACPPKV